MIGWFLALVIAAPPILEYECRDCHCAVFRDMDGVYCGTCGQRFRDTDHTPEYV